jgi:MoaA/NifB/PqqE/SkfB family radical SAM enzyme
MPAAKVKDVIDQAHEDFDCLIFSGGEPFLHPDLIELVHYADRKGSSVHITTSGFGVTQKKR